MRDDGVVLLVDPDRDTLAMFEEVVVSRLGGNVVASTDFIAARKRLLEDRPHLLITNLRLGGYNGLHLVYLAATLGLGTRCIVYSDHHDSMLMQEARAAGAAYEPRQRIPYILASYANASPPALRRA